MYIVELAWDWASHQKWFIVWEEPYQLILS
jgi:hypothetical protein